MPSVKPETTIGEYRAFVNEVYGLSNDRYFSVGDMLSNVERFLMRGLKGIRKGDKEKTKLNLLISLSWFMSLLNRLHIEIDDEIWRRFPYVCSYCASLPCACKTIKPTMRQTVIINESKRPKTIREHQLMFEKIYPSQSRTLDHAGIHLAEEMGELAEAILGYLGRHEDQDFSKVAAEAADLLSCYLAVFNSLGLEMSDEIVALFNNNCHVCHNSPCSCTFGKIMEFKF